MFIALRQPVCVAFAPEGEVGLHPLICPALVVIQTVFFQHHRQPFAEHGEVERVLVAVRLHIDQIGVIEVQARLTRDNIRITA
ncbi:hypothetical protein D3C78_1113310 [compost metagenome]